MSAFARRVVQLDRGAYLDHRDAGWQNAIVFLVAGEFHVECSGGDSHSFRAGDILTLARLPIRRAHNSGATLVRLVAIRRRAAPVTLPRAHRHTERDHEQEAP